MTLKLQKIDFWIFKKLHLDEDKGFLDFLKVHKAQKRFITLLSFFAASQSWQAG